MFLSRPHLRALRKVLDFGHPSPRRTFAQLNSFLLFAASGAPPRSGPPASNGKCGSPPIGSWGASPFQAHVESQQPDEGRASYPLNAQISLKSVIWSPQLICFYLVVSLVFFFFHFKKADGCCWSGDIKVATGLIKGRN